ncbi:hypothetical protein [Sphingomonas echinoides]|jgi:hypothetical protein|uniref:Uncharacterized protein n=1 Tax=Sphingomonas echinoides TaxID=59803 RepID=A0ABU4PNF6_9SPHN|nr:hypothetical protein [Sphingomonas echinoides]MDX5985367.1 hypothetical protein [Sphingomonas echinoides]
MTVTNKSFDQSRQIAMVGLIVLVLGLWMLGSNNAFASDIVKLLYILAFSVALRFALPKQPSAKLRFVRSVPWIALISACLTAGSTLLFPEPTEGPVVGLVVFGFYLGLPILFFTSLLTFVRFPTDNLA